MSVGIISILAVAAAIIVALICARPLLQSSGGSLIRRFGPEYERSVDQHKGDNRAAVRELSERVRHYGDLSPQELSAHAREQYVAQWAGLQERFVDAPADAVAGAALLLDRLARDRGYPSGDIDKQIDALSVHHAHHVEGYRRLHRLTQQSQAAEVSETKTEEMRRAMVAARGLFEQLVAAQPSERRTGARRLLRVPRQNRHSAHHHRPKNA